MLVSEAGRIKLSRLTNKVARIVRHDSTYVHMMNMILSFVASFEEAYYTNLDRSGTIEIVKDVVSSDSLKLMSAQSIYRYIRAAT